MSDAPKAGSVTIGGKTLAVKVAMLGFLRNTVLPARRKIIDSTTEEESIDAIVALILAYVGDNEGVDADFILANVPSDPRPFLAECVRASGQMVAAPGEAHRP
jgi:hypothetical protein